MVSLIVKYPLFLTPRLRQTRVDSDLIGASGGAIETDILWIFDILSKYDLKEGTQKTNPPAYSVDL